MLKYYNPTGELLVTNLMLLLTVNVVRELCHLAIWCIMLQHSSVYRIPLNTAHLYFLKCSLNIVKRQPVNNKLKHTYHSDISPLHRHIWSGTAQSSPLYWQHPWYCHHGLTNASRQGFATPKINKQISTLKCLIFSKWPAFCLQQAKVCNNMSTC